MKSNSCIGFCKFLSEEFDEIRYGCRGIGEEYDEFYRWLENKSYQTTSHDWPWHYFKFDNIEDANEFEQKYKNDIYDESTL